jgi:dipeptidyl-peptidase-3
MFLDVSIDPTVTSKTPGPGRDILTASSNNLYSGVTATLLETFTERYGLNSRLTVDNGGLV